MSWILYNTHNVNLKLDLSHRLRMFKNMVPRQIFGPKREEETGENCISRSFTISILPQILLGCLHPVG
jgi:hypothetical protein